MYKQYINKLVLIPLCMLDCISLKQKTEADKGTYTTYYTLFGRQIKITFKS